MKHKCQIWRKVEIHGLVVEHRQIADFARIGEAWAAIRAIAAHSPGEIEYDGLSCICYLCRTTGTWSMTYVKFVKGA